VGVTVTKQEHLYYQARSKFKPGGCDFGDLQDVNSPLMAQTKSPSIARQHCTSSYQFAFKSNIPFEVTTVWHEL
jgi:hypothetical protein